LGMTRLLLEKNPKEEQLKYLNSIKHASDNLLVIINDILDLSKIEAGKITFEKIDFNLATQLQTVITTFKLSAEEKSLALTHTIDPDVPVHLIGDPYRLNQILMNLTSNAIKFTDAGSVSIVVKQKSKSDKEVQLEFSVTDTGIGIAKDKLDYIFNIFTQESSSTTRRFGGTGLGLSICKRLVELQGGTIRVVSETGKGSTFSFHLHFGISDKGEQNAIQQTEFEPALRSLSDIKILLAEDNEFNQIVAVDTLEELIKNVKVDIAKTGKEAVDMVMQGDYDVVLMDIQMPEMDGYEATKKIRSSNDARINAIPIIAMTASVVKAEVDKCFESGMNAFVGKPFNAEELIDKITKTIRN
ncbi:MAG: ATP-binding protein, partial [Chitinophagales bacterium]